MRIQKRSRKNKPAVSEAKELTQRSRLKSLVKNTFNTKNNIICIMDDVPYFMLDGKKWQGRQYFKGKKHTDNKIKYLEHIKFPCNQSARNVGTSVFEFGLAVNSDRLLSTGCQK